MVVMNVNKTLLFLTFLLILTTGCMSKKSKLVAAPLVYINPCNVIGENILIEAVGEPLGSGIISQPLAHAFVDNLLDKRLSIMSTYSLNCGWGRNVGEKSDLYYCTGAYTAPQLSSENVIERYVKKDFKVGFSVEERPGSSWTVDGKAYQEPTKFYLTVKSVEATCTLAV